MILLFGNKANKSAASQRSNSVKNNNPVENSGILAMSPSEAKSLLTMGEYDTYISSNPVAINYAMYAACEFDTNEDSGFMSDFSAAVAMLGDCGGFDCGASSYSSAGASCTSFSSVG